MKTVIFVRHAKSSWANPDLADFDRPLNKRGYRDAPYMGNLMKEKGINPDIIISSPAIRAITTAKHFAELLNYSIEEIKKNKIIYEYGPNGILRILHELDDSIDSVMFFGHNPDMTHLVTFLSGEYFQNVPTCGIVCIDFEIDSWIEISENTGAIRFFEYPKMYFK